MVTCKERISYVDYLVLYTEQSREEAINIGHELGKSGYVVETQILDTLLDHIQYAEQAGIKEIIAHFGTKLKVVSIQENHTKNVSIDDFLKKVEKNKDRELVLSIH